jgi:hypothetical protein
VPVIIQTLSIIIASYNRQIRLIAVSTMFGSDSAHPAGLRVIIGQDSNTPAS